MFFFLSLQTHKWQQSIDNETVIFAVIRYQKKVNSLAQNF